MSREPDVPADVELPPRLFLFTIDQVANIIQLPESVLWERYLRRLNVDRFRRTRHHLELVNISPPGYDPEWRVAERELVRWLWAMRVQVYERSYTRRLYRRDTD